MKINSINYKIVRSKFEYLNGELISKTTKRKVGFLNQKYIRVSMGSKQYYAHQLIWLLFNTKLTKTIDHINGVRTDNRIENLRAASYGQNNFNVKKKSHAKVSKYKGVLKIESKSKPWGASIQKNGKRFYLGSFETETEAAQAYDARAKKLHGRFACLNF